MALELAVDPNHWTRSDNIALIALVVSSLGIILALITLRRGNRNSSVASMIPLNSEIRDMWEKYLSTFPEQNELENVTPEEMKAFESAIDTGLENFMNVLEIAAAIEVEGTLSGVSRTLMRDYVQRMLSSVISNSYTSGRASALLQDENTFLYIRRFLNSRQNISVVLPPNWYTYPRVGWWDRAKSRFRY